MVWFEIADEPYIAVWVRGKPAILHSANEIGRAWNEPKRVACFILCDMNKNLYRERENAPQPTIQDVNTCGIAVFLRDATPVERQQYQSEKTIVLLAPSLILDQRVIFRLTGLKALYQPIV